MAQARDPLFLPTDQSPGQMMGAWSTALAIAAYDIGVRIDAVCKARIGPNWARALEDARFQEDRRYRVNIVDPSWVFSEPTKPNSPIAAILPDGAPVLFKKVNRRRNDWFHKNSPWDLDELDASVEILQDAVRLTPEIRAFKELNELAGHLFELRQHKRLPSEEERQLREILEQERAALDEANQRLGQALEDLRNRQDGTEDNEVERQLEEQVRMAQDRAKELEERVRQLERTTQPDPDDMLPISLRPGDPWPADVPMGTRRLRLLRAPQRDIIDPESGEFLSTAMGDSARAAADRWLTVMPLGGDIHVTKAWNSAGLVFGRMTYLGRLDEQPEQERVVGAPVMEFLLPRSYIYTGTDVLESGNEVPLSEYLGSTGCSAVVARLSAAITEAKSQGLFDDDDLADVNNRALELRASLSGHLVTSMGEDRGYLTTVSADEWFPMRRS